MQQNKEKEFNKLLRTAWVAAFISYGLWRWKPLKVEQNKYRSQLLWNAEWWHSDIDNRVSMD
ncbi:MAG: hypothetical protein ACLVIY_04915 [Anaerobutyricum soehngenii]